MFLRNANRRRVSKEKVAGLWNQFEAYAFATSAGRAPLAKQCFVMSDRIGKPVRLFDVV
jgi:hypothetical protein